MPIDSQFDPPPAQTHETSTPNPATLSADMAALFPAGVVAAELQAPGDPSLLYPEESVSVAKAVPRRAQEFAAGRLCARRALAEFGIRRFPLEAGADRAPRWPDTIVGSITHARGFCAVAVAGRQRFQGLGLDVEVVGDLSPQLWPRICVAAESEWLDSLPDLEKTPAAALIFSAKEAFYKCMYPATGERLNFADVCVGAPSFSAVDENGGQGQLIVTPMRTLVLERGAVPALNASYRFHGRYVSVGVALTAEGLSMIQ